MSLQTNQWIEQSQQCLINNPTKRVWQPIACLLSQDHLNVQLLSWCDPK